MIKVRGGGICGVGEVIGDEEIKELRGNVIRGIFYVDVGIFSMIVLL